MEADVEKAPLPSKTEVRVPVAQANEWIQYLSQQALIYQGAAREIVDSAFESSRNRMSEILWTASAHSQLTLEALAGVVSDLTMYEEIAVRKIKDGIHTVSSNPLTYGAIAAGLSAVVFKRPRRFLYYKALPLFVSEEAMILRAEAEVKQLRHSFNVLKAESEKLEKRAISAEEEFIRGKTKLRQAGKQIQSAIQSAYKIQRQATGLKVILRELPSREGTKFHKQVKSLGAEVKKEKNLLGKEVNKINNYGISV